MNGGFPIAAAAVRELVDRCAKCGVPLDDSNQSRNLFLCYPCAGLNEPAEPPEPTIVLTRQQTLHVVNALELEHEDLGADLSRLDLPQADRAELLDRRSEIRDILDLFSPNWSAVPDSELELQSVEIRRQR